MPLAFGTSFCLKKEMEKGFYDLKMHIMCYKSCNMEYLSLSTELCELDKTIKNTM